MSNEKDADRYPLLDGILNSSVPDAEAMRLSSQCISMYRRLLEGPATNVELMQLTNSKAPSARRSDLRAELKVHNWGMELIRRCGGGVNLYAITRPDGSIVGVEK